MPQGSATWMSTGQSRHGSLLEALANVIAGYGMALLVQAVAYPHFGIATTFDEDAAIASIFTAASMVRSYLIRRLFEFITRRGNINQVIDNART
jgi:6-phosphogluconate dehydrogenase (decarboxylating)